MANVWRHDINYCRSNSFHFRLHLCTLDSHTATNIVPKPLHDHTVSTDWAGLLYQILSVALHLRWTVLL